MDAQVPKPKLEMVVPYKEYKLVHSDGSTPDRTKKHPFCMSRVHYSEAGELPPQHYIRRSQASHNIYTFVLQHPVLCNTVDGRFHPSQHVCTVVI